MVNDTYCTPPELAHRWRCKPEKVIAWIKAGELAAVNVANRGKRARWVVSPQAIADFEQRRAAEPARCQQRTRRNRLAGIRRWF